jgi:hypothetical protein
MITAEAGTGVAAGMGAAVGTAGAAGEALAGTGVAAGTKQPVGAAEAGTTTVGISVGTSTDGAARDGKGPSPRPNFGMAGVGQVLSAEVPAGGIGAMPGRGIISVGDGVQALGHGVACWWVHRSV